MVIHQLDLCLLNAWHMEGYTNLQRFKSEHYALEM